MSLIAGSTIERASSGSRSSISSIDPLMSANSAVTVLRSPSIDSSELLSGATRIAALAVVVGGAGDVDKVSEFPHSPQNFSPDSLDAPHRGHFGASASPHCAQNLRPSRLSTPHFMQHMFRFLTHLA